MIEVRGLWASYGSFSLKDVTLSVSRGESFALVGPSGAGKTLLMETLLGLRKPERGTISIDGVRADTLPPEERGIAYLPQDLALFPHLNVVENIAFCLRWKHLPEAEVTKKVSDLAGILGITPLLGRRSVTNLSGGEKQRVALARALAGTPRCLFLDEPFCSLDGARRRELHFEVRTLQQKLGLTILMVTHDYQEALVLADTMALMREGRIIHQAPPTEMFENPGSLWASRFLLFENVFQGIYRGKREDGLHSCAVDGEVLPLPGPIPVKESEVLWVGIRARHLHLSRETCRDPAQAVKIRAVAQEERQFGDETMIVVRLKEASGVSLVVRTDTLNRDRIPRPGEWIDVYFSPQDVKGLDSHTSPR